MIEFILKKLHQDFRDASFEHGDRADTLDEACEDEESAQEAGVAHGYAMAARRCRMILLAIATAEWLEAP